MKSAALVESIYEAAFVPERWPGVLDRLCESSGSASSTLLFLTVSLRRAGRPPGAPVACSNRSRAPMCGNDMNAALNG